MFETFVGTQAGVLRVNGGGRELGLAEHQISAIHAFHDRAGSSVVLAGSYGEGLFRSADGGRTWTPITAGMTAPAARTICPDPLVPGAILCGTEPARLYRSADDGLTWTELAGIRAIAAHSEWYLPYSPRAGAVRNFYAPPGPVPRLLAAVEVGGLIQSADGGVSWTVRPVGPNDDLHQVTGHPAQAGRLWTALGYAALPAGARPAGSARRGGVARSDDGGEAWTVLHTEYTRSVMVPPASPGLVLAGPAGEVGHRGRIEVSSDDGRSWQAAGGGVETPMPDMVELFVPAPDGTIFAVCSGGRLLRSEPGPWRWRSALPARQPDNALSVCFLVD